MTRIAVLGLCTLLCAAVWAQETYVNRFEHLDLDKVLTSKRLVDNYVLCLTNKKKPCPPEGTEIKRLLPEILETTCAKCTDSQIQKAAQVLRKLRKDYPDSYKKLADTWDPTGEYFKKFEQMAKSRKLI